MTSTPAAPAPPWHALDAEAVAHTLEVEATGLSDSEAAERLRRFGPNRLEPPPPPSRLRVLVRQFASPLIYVLIAAAAIALAVGEVSDAGFIAAVLLLNAAIGFFNEFRAEQAVQALLQLVRARARVRRGQRTLDIDGEEVVPGDLLLVESGDRLCADVRFLEARALRVDESVLTGESVPVEKDESFVVPEEAPLAERRNMAFAGSIVASGRGVAQGLVCVKGAPERVLEMCDRTLSDEGALIALDRAAELASAEALMAAGFRVLALADAETPAALAEGATPAEPIGLVFLGLVAMDDPPREGVRAAMASCREAGIHVVMVTGDHATTGRAIAARVGLAESDAPVLTGREIEALDDAALQKRIRGCRVVARATPTDKLRVVRAAQESGAFVAVTGDGVNDAPALRQADLGVAMGQSGNDVAREAADLVITDDDFSSIVAGVREGRVAYDNVRKVTYLLISTGAGEVLAVSAAMALGLPVPFTAVQLLWLNLVTNGIQDVALAFEPPEPGVLKRTPRPPREGIFDRVMIERTLLAGAVFGLVGLGAFWSWLADGRSVDEARNLLVQLFVLFEIFHIGNSRSETRSLFRLSPLANPILLAGTLAAMTVHGVALYTPFFQELLDIQPLRLDEWASLAAMAASIVVVMEGHKALRARWPSPGQVAG